jgi:RNA polymerase sigma factor (sigma-70 family)
MTAAPSEGDLVRLALTGDPTAFASLYRANVGAVSRVVRAGIANGEAAADTVQDVFVKALERLGSLREPDRFRPWLLAIARHAVVDRHRSAGRAPTTSLDEEWAEEPVEAGPSSEELAELSELADLVAGCVAALSLRDATAVSMVTHLGLGPAEVAVALGVSRDTAKVIIHRARRHLRDALALELMVRRIGPGCPQFDAIDREDIVAAARHVRSCTACTGLVESEVHLYGSEQHDPERYPSGRYPSEQYPSEAETLHPHVGIA